MVSAGWLIVSGDYSFFEINVVIFVGGGGGALFLLIKDGAMLLCHFV